MNPVISRRNPSSGSGDGLPAPNIRMTTMSDQHHQCRADQLGNEWLPGDGARRRLLRWWGWFLLTTIALAIVIALRYFIAADLDAAPLSVAFRAAMLLTHMATLSAVALSPVLLLSVVAPRSVVVIAIGVVCSTFVLAALLLDTQVYLLYRFHINAGVFNLLLGGAARETFIFPGVMYAQAALAVMAVVLVLATAGCVLWRYVRVHPARPAIASGLAVGLVGAMLSFHLTHIWADAVAYKPLLEQTDVLPLRYAATAKRSLRRLGFEVRSEPALAANARQDRNGLAYPLHPVECSGSPNPLNFIVIMIDSWRFDALNATVTPNIEAFSRRSVRFTNHYSGGNATRIGVFSFFYSIPGTYWHKMLVERQGPVFLEQLLQQGYEVRAFRGAPLFSPEFDRTVFTRTAALRLRSDGAGPADWDRDLTDDFAAFLSSRPKQSPFFAFLFYDSPHDFELPGNYPRPFKPSADRVNYFALDDPLEAKALFNRYRNSVHYVDSLVGEALAALAAQRLLEDSV